MSKPLTVQITQTVENSSRDGNTRPPDLPPKKSVCGQETTVRTEHVPTDWFQIRKGVCQGSILSPCLFNLYAEYIMWNAGLDEAQAGIKIARRNINNLRYADNTTFMAERKTELKRLFMKVKEESEKFGLIINIQKTKIMASTPITLWQIHGKTMETARDFIFGGSKIIADGDYSHEIKRCLFLWRKVMTNLDSILKIRDYFVNKSPSSQSKGFSISHVWMWELNCGLGRRLLRVPGTARRSNQSILKKISPRYSLEGMMLKLKLQYFGHLMQRTD